jgi:hypothetical protein
MEVLVRTALSARPRAALSLCLLLGAGALIAACSGSSTTSTGPAATTPATTAAPTGTAGANGAALADFRTCMSQHGVDVPAGGNGGGGGGAGGQGSIPRNGGTGPRGTGGAGNTTGTARRNGGGAGGGFPGLDMTDPATQAAFTACQDKLPAGFSGGGAGGAGAGGAGGGGQRAQAMQPYLSCLRDHGVTVPTAGAGGAAGGPNGTNRRASVDTSDPNYAAANQACQSLLPAGQGGNGGGGGNAASDNGAASGGQ